jgi:hypothetical protein
MIITLSIISGVLLLTTIKFWSDAAYFEEKSEKAQQDKLAQRINYLNAVNKLEESMNKTNQIINDLEALNKRK